MAWDLNNEAQWTYKDIPLGVVAIEGGTSEAYETGSWRTDRPIWNEDNCTDCMLCWVSCPDSSITVNNQKMSGIDLMHCKGCGVCVTVCHFDALEMMNEEDAKGIDICEM